ncbi:MAG: hypothetical protein OSJ52_07265, partial [Lachnospiraceae bacterium]|nr:hypothetical protein [Lachnospiraceae bacterium]
NLTGVEGFHQAEHIVLVHENMKAVNTKDDPNQVAPKTLPLEEGSQVTLPAHSWNVIRLKKESEKGKKHGSDKCSKYNSRRQGCPGNRAGLYPYQSRADRRKKTAACFR